MKDELLSLDIKDIVDSIRNSDVLKAFEQLELESDRQTKHNSMLETKAEVKVPLEPKQKSEPISQTESVPKLEPEIASVSEEYPFAFPIDIFPEKLQRIARILHEDEGHNPDYLGASMLTVLAAAMGNLWVCQFSTTWIASPIIFMVLVGPHSCGKTPPLRLAARPFHLYDAELYNLYRKEKEMYDKAMELPRDEREANGFEKNPVKPVCKSVVTTNTTIEGLYTALDKNRRGVLMHVDELDSFLGNMSRYSRGNDEAYWLQLFNGDEIKCNRKSSDDSFSIQHPYVSVIGGTQPGILPELFGGKRLMNGFASRLLKVFPDINEMPGWKTQHAPQSVIDEWNALVRMILEEPTEYDENGDVRPHVLQFSREAKEMLCRWKNVENGKAWQETEDGYLKGFFGKLETYAVRFSLVLQVVRSFCEKDCSREVIDETSVKSAIELAEYFRRMEKKAYRHMGQTSEADKDMLLFDRMPDEFTAADAYTFGVSVGKSKSTMKRFLNKCRDVYGILEKAGHGCYRKVHPNPDDDPMSL